MDYVDLIQIVSHLVLVGAAILQTIIIFLSFKLARNFLSDHKSKVKAENQEKYAFEIIEILVKLEDVLDEIISNEMSEQEKSDIEKNPFEIYEKVDILVPFYKNHWVKERFIKKKRIITKLSRKFKVYARFLNDHQLLELHDKFLKNFKIVVTGYKSALVNQTKLYDETSNKQNLATSIWCDKFLKITKNLPKDINDSENPSLNNFYIHFEGISEYLKKYIN
ncbi:hypothetical protein [Cyclobacterium marinum]|uniref:Uncharacterized protein n=1 Tax=Cyclobacterium marinum (strain ATCC 25205 / DSM 745 / LMG 13164 / NCIMB 1802) TaxID=880070 RepID=G0J0N1_CYCMS|nr:hypothetical protein [Cyclobacterium marinum]AEL24443.1 hypothetical protein Cycma_0668 [Cyclobacterium marinum DSM 745]